MPNPKSRYSEVVSTLQEFLTQESAPYEPVVWNWYSNTIAPGDPPRGRVYLTNFLNTKQKQADFRPTDFRLTIELAIAKEKTADTFEAAHAWAGFLAETVLPKLRKEGHKLAANTNPNQATLFRGVEWLQGAIGQQETNQDGGLIAIIRIPLMWKDESGQASGYALDSFKI